jgi:hypothetical protein
MSRKSCVITINKGNLKALKTESAQKRIKETRERSQIIQDQIREDLRVTPDRLKHFFNI